MSLATLLVHPVVIITPGSRVDRYGNDVPDWDAATSVSTRGWFRQRSSAETNEGRDSIVTQAGVTLAADEQIDAYCRVQIFGVLYDVDGTPVVARTPRGAHHLEVSLVESEG